MTDVNHSHGAVQFKVVSRRWGKSILFMLWARSSVGLTDGGRLPSFQGTTPTPPGDRSCGILGFVLALCVSSSSTFQTYLDASCDGCFAPPPLPPPQHNLAYKSPALKTKTGDPETKRKTNEATGKKPKEERTLLTTGVGDGEILVDAGGTGLAEHRLRRLQVAPLTALASRPHLRHRLRRLAVCAQKELTALPAGPPHGWNGLTTTCPGRNGLTTMCPGRNGLTTTCPGRNGLTTMCPGRNGLTTTCR